jgi:HAE1 family hydrophobic/amphiphilic exporter-1
MPIGAAQALQQAEPEVPESYEARVRNSGAFLELSLRDAIRLALTNNLDLEIENYNEDLNRMRVFGTKGYYDPVLSFSLGWNSTKRPNTSVLDAGARVPTSIFKRWVFDTQFTQNVVGGGNFSATFNNDRFTTNSAYTYINPQYGSDLAFTFTQPLMRGFLQTQTERQLKIYNLDTKISDSQFKQRVSEIIQQVQNQYWELEFTIQNFEARRRSLELAIVQYKNNQKRVDIGVMAPIEITSSRAEVATREQDMIQSEVQIINAQNALKNLLAPDPKDSLWSLTLLPTEEPKMVDITVSLDDAIQTALNRRPELEQLTLQMEQSGVNREYYKSQGKPAVNLRFGLTSTGTSGTVLGSEAIDTTGDGVPDTIITGVPQPDNPFYGGFGNAFSQVGKFSYLNYVAAVDVEIPLRNRSVESQLAQVAITERQLQSRTKSAQQLIMVDVRNAYEQIATRKKGLESARVARQLTQEQLDGENKRFEAGLSTNFEVLRYQRDLADAQVQELRAMVDYQVALVALQKAMFTIIDQNDITTARRDN